MKNPVKTLCVLAILILSVSSAAGAAESDPEPGAPLPGMSTRIKEAVDQLEIGESNQGEESAHLDASSQGEETSSSEKSNPSRENFSLQCEAMLEHDNYSGLLDACDEAIAANPKNAEAYIYRAVARWFLDEAHEAVVADLNLAIEVEPDSADGYLARAGFFEVTHQIELAIRDYETVLKLEPSNIEVLSALINRNAELQNWDKVVANCSYWISIAPGEPAPYYLRATGKVELGDTTAAIEDLEKFSKLLVALKRTGESDQIKKIIAELKNGNLKVLS